MPQHTRSLSDVEIKDLSLEDYIGVAGKCATYLPHTAGRYQKKRFRKAQVCMLGAWVGPCVWGLFGW